MKLETLHKTFLKGVSKDPGQVRELLGLEENADDAKVAYAVLKGLTSQNLEQLSLSPTKNKDPRSVISIPVKAIDSEGPSLLNRLTKDLAQGGNAFAELTDIRTLLALLRAGSFVLRRAALRRIEALLHQDLPNDELRKLSEALQENRDLEISFELGIVSGMLPGSAGRKSRAEQARWRRIAEEFDKNVEAFWQGNLSTDPLSMLPADQRAQIGLRSRQLSDTTLRYFTSVLEGSDGVAELEQSHPLLVSLRYAGDARLVPSLLMLLESNDFQIAAEAARALGHIADPRVHPALFSAFDRSVSAKERLVFAAGLGLQGDISGRAYVRERLQEADAAQLSYVLEGLETLGGAEDVEAVALLLEEDDLALNLSAVRALGRFGDVRALIPLRNILQSPHANSIRAEIEDALYAVRERLFLRGEEIPENETAVFALQAVSKAQLSAKRDPAAIRFRSYWDYIRGWTWMLVGFSRRAIARFEGAASRRPGWVHPLLSIAMIHSGRNRYAHALTAFRRAIEADKAHVERNPLIARTLALCFLRRAEQIEQEGRRDVAQSIIDEVLALDLRFAPAPILFELRRRRDQFRLSESS